mgnify:CR=1 FL=1
MEDALIIQGGKQLKGNVKVSGAKNVALKVIIASLLFDGEVVLKNIPKIADVFELLDLIQKLGGKAQFEGDHTVVVEGKGISKNRVDLLHGSKLRVSFMMFAPLLQRYSIVSVPNPGGCRIGARPIDRIIEGMQKLGIIVSYDSNSGYYTAKLDKPPSGNYRFYKPSHTGTELLIMLGMLAKSTVTISNAAQEPEIDELIAFLNAGGANIRKSQTTISISPSSKNLRLNEPFTIGGDRNEAVTFATLAVATKGDITVSGLSLKLIASYLNELKKVGAGVETINQNDFRVFYRGALNPTKVETSPHPGFMTDWQPNLAVLMTQAKGESVIIERVFENRFSYVSELRRLGAEIEFIRLPINNPLEYFFFNFDPSKKYNQAIKITGPQALHGGVLTVSDLRAGATLAIAALIAEGESVVNGLSILERGYENFAEKITSLGGEIEKV